MFLGDTLVRIARDTVATLEYVLDPPANYPPGVGPVLVQGMPFEVDPAGRTSS